MATTDRTDPCSPPWREWLKPQTIIAVLCLVFGLVGGVYAMRERITAINDSLSSHATNCDVHHSTEALDATYARRDVLEAQLESIDRRLSRIEDAVGTKP